MAECCSCDGGRRRVGFRDGHPIANIARLSCSSGAEMNSPIQWQRFASMCHDIASAEDGAGSGISLRISLPSSQPQLCE
jgi:hypothetical protein